MRPTDEDMTDIEKMVCHSPFPRGGDLPHRAGPLREVPGLGRRQRKSGKHGQEPYCGFQRKECRR